MSKRAEEYYDKLVKRGDRGKAQEFLSLLSQGANVRSAIKQLEGSRTLAENHYDNLVKAGNQDEANAFLRLLANNIPVSQAVRQASLQGGSLRGMLSTLSEGSLFGWSDELRSQALQAIHGLSPEEARMEVQDDKSRRAALRRDHPIAATALEIGGGAATSMIPLTRFAGTGARGLAATGAIEGAIAGAGSAEPGSRFGGAVAGGAAGAGIGLAGAGAAALAQRGAGLVGRAGGRIAERARQRDVYGGAPKKSPAQIFEEVGLPHMASKVADRAATAATGIPGIGPAARRAYQAGRDLLGPPPAQAELPLIAPQSVSAPRGTLPGLGEAKPLNKVVDKIEDAAEKVSKKTKEKRKGKSPLPGVYAPPLATSSLPESVARLPDLQRSLFVDLDKSLWRQKGLNPKDAKELGERAVELFGDHPDIMAHIEKHLERLSPGFRGPKAPAAEVDLEDLLRRSIEQGRGGS